MPLKALEANLREASARRANLSALAVILAGSLLHFAWEWTDRNPVVAVFAAINESTWEHLKLAFWPALLVGLGHRWLYDAPQGWRVATALRCVIPPVAIILLFYGYVAAAGGNHLFADITVFVVAILAGEHVGHAVLDREFDEWVAQAAGALLLLLAVAFAVFTFQPPDFFLFLDPVVVRIGAG